MPIAMLELLFTPKSDMLLIAGVIILVIIIIGSLLGLSNRDPNKWYGEMICFKCGYLWQSRRNTPPARCPSCSSTQISIKTGAITRVPTQDLQAVRVNKAELFFSFAGFSYGDKLDKAEKVLGAPDEIMDNPRFPFITYYYFPAEYAGHDFTLSHDRTTHQIIIIEISGAKVIGKLILKGISDAKMSYIGQEGRSIKANFGQPTSEIADTYQYDFDQAQNPRICGQVTFACYSHDNYNCSNIQVQWFFLNS